MGTPPERAGALSDHLATEVQQPIATYSTLASEIIIVIITIIIIIILKRHPSLANSGNWRCRKECNAAFWWAGTGSLTSNWKFQYNPRTLENVSSPMKWVLLCDMCVLFYLISHQRNKYLCYSSPGNVFFKILSLYARTLRRIHVVLGFFFTFRRWVSLHPLWL